MINNFKPRQQGPPSTSSMYSTIRATLCPNFPAVPHSTLLATKNTKEVLKGTLFMENAKHFGEHFRKHHKNQKRLQITLLTRYLHNVHKTSQVKRITRPLLEENGQMLLFSQ